VGGDPDQPALFVDSSGDRLPDPPDCIGRELVAPFWIEFFNTAQQANAAFLDEITEGERVVTASDPDNKPLVGLEES
jgi:hypothetical protein